MLNLVSSAATCSIVWSIKTLKKTIGESHKKYGKSYKIKRLSSQTSDVYQKHKHKMSKFLFCYVNIYQ